MLQSLRQILSKTFPDAFKAAQAQLQARRVTVKAIKPLPRPAQKYPHHVLWEVQLQAWRDFESRPDLMTRTAVVASLLDYLEAIGLDMTQRGHQAASVRHALDEYLKMNILSGCTFLKAQALHKAKSLALVATTQAKANWYAGNQVVAA